MLLKKSNAFLRLGLLLKTMKSKDFSDVKGITERIMFLRGVSAVTEKSKLLL